MSQIDGVPVIYEGEKEVAMLKRSDDFLVQVVKGEAVLLNAKTGDYFGLNQAGNDFYQLIDGQRTFEEIIDLLDREYQVQREQLWSDCKELVDLLLKKGILLAEDAQ